MLGHSGEGEETASGSRSGPVCSSLPLILTAINKEKSQTGLAGFRVARSLYETNNETKKTSQVRLGQKTTGALTRGHVFVAAWADLSKTYRGHEQNALGSPYVLQGPDADDRVGGSWA